MMTTVQKKVFSQLPVSQHFVVNEITILLIKQQIAEYAMEIDYFEKKYVQDFSTFDHNFQQNQVSYQQENDWLSWKFAIESRHYWQDLLVQAK